MINAATSKKVLDTLKAMSAIAGRDLSEYAAAILLEDLRGYHEADVLKALSRFRRERSGMPSTADILSRIDDGRPGVEEAWAMIPKDEYQTVVWTKEMRAAFTAVRHMVEEDPIAARMAFKEVYVKMLTDARAERAPVKWEPSLGHDLKGRELVLKEAVAKGLLSDSYVQALLPAPTPPKRTQIEGPKDDGLTQVDALAMLAKIKRTITGEA